MPAVKPFPTTVKVQCRSEEPFNATIRFAYIPGKGLTPFIDCPHCGREYYLKDDGNWESDRPLVFLMGG